MARLLTTYKHNCMYTPMRRTKEDAALTREQVLHAALKVFSQKGYAATTLEDIASSAGVTRGAVYWHFKNKADLYATLLEERFAKVHAFYKETLSSKGSPLAILERLLVRSLEYLEEDPEYRAVAMLSWFKTEVTPELETGFRYKIEGIRAFVNTLEGLIKRGIQEGEIHRSINPRAAAVAAIGLMNGVSTMYLMDPSLTGEKADRRLSVETFLRGLRA